MTLRPRSVPGLLISGFIFVALPLMVAIGFAVVYVDRLSDQSQRLVRQGVEVTRLSRRINNSITSMERAARQYAVLGDPVLAKRFREHHQAFQQAITEIANLQLDTVPNWDLAALRHQAEVVGQTLAVQPLDPETLNTELDRFVRMRDLAQAITDQGDAFIDSELGRIESTAREVRFFLLLCVFALVPATVLLVVLFTTVISRPIRQIHAAIRRMGEGDLTRPVKISAPSAELDALGQQLDWMRRRLEQLESEKNQFLQHMSHELKTPLASIREGVELMRDGTLGALSEAQTEVVAILQRNSLDLMALIENLLNFAAWRQQQAALERWEFNVRELVSELKERHRLVIEARGLSLTMPGPTLRVWADRDRLALMLDNLLSNAVKFSPPRGQISIDGRHTRTTTVIEVCDEGPGIPKDEREHVFAPFYQAGPETGSHVRGTGIGLSVAREAVRAHGGTIAIIDRAGKGACFRIRLPLAEAK